MCFTRLSLALFLLLLTAVFSGCASQSFEIDTWEGKPAGAAQAAVLDVPPGVKVLKIDGKAQRSWPIDNIRLRYRLLPGPHTLEYRYERVWATPDADAEGRSVETVRSEPVRFTYRFDAGESYVIQIREPGSRLEAQQLALRFDPEVREAATGRSLTAIDPEGDQSQPSEGGVPEAGRAVQLEVPAGDLESRSGGPSAKLAPVPASEPLDALKQAWEQASPAERQAFMTWALQ